MLTLLGPHGFEKRNNCCPLLSAYELEESFRLFESILRMSLVRFREVKGPAHGCTASQQQVISRSQATRRNLDFIHRKDCSVCFSLGIDQVIEPVRDKAVLSCGYNIFVNELVNMRVYWQKQTEMVLSVINGKVEVWKNYENRTIADFSGNHSLVILGLRLSDSGTYTCVIQKLDKMSYKVEHLAYVKLLVKAYFPVPSITDLGNSFPNIRRIYCSTSGGFPEPQLFWLENGKELNATNITVSQDPETKLYTIGGELDFNVTKNHNFLCLVKYGDLKVSQTFIWEKSE
ncbi:T-lymphocyte activation antigen CD80 [Suncus etruscus]|uniref:T-lymphocyte activation antigen CD80 n=1 Tax=Suncus etruscus TaxID=109475 RepID=UPI00210F5015|nr:T-lymphocyte activation antigen CD80 [Suncus etruscus]